MVGLIFPNHGMTIPSPMKTFLSMCLDLTQTKYLFALVTRGGSVFHGFSKINQLVKSQHVSLKATFILDMFNNDPKLKAFEVPTSKEITAMRSLVDKKVQEIAHIVKHELLYADEDRGVHLTANKFFDNLLEPMITYAVHNVAPNVKKYFYTTEKCTGCGICAQMCLSEKIKMQDNRPVWDPQVKCFICYGCLNYCPSHAIEIYSKIYMKSFTPVKGRYPHPFGSLKEIIQQKAKT